MSEPPTSSQPFPDPAGPGPDGLVASAAPKPRRRRGWLAAGVAVALLALAALGTGGALLGTELTREPTAREVKAAGEKEMALRTGFRTAGEIFPTKLTNGDEAAEGPKAKSTVRRIGIAQVAKCADAVDKEVAAVLTKHGCTTILRATYLDAGGARLATVGIVALRDVDAVRTADNDLPDGKGLRAVAFPGTVSAEFDDARRQEMDVQSRGPYLLMRTVGYTDGRKKVSSDENAKLFQFAEILMRNIGGRLIEETPPCKLETVQC